MPTAINGSAVSAVDVMCNVLQLVVRPSFLWASSRLLKTDSDICTCHCL